MGCGSSSRVECVVANQPIKDSSPRKKLTGNGACITPLKDDCIPARETIDADTINDGNTGNKDAEIESYESVHKNSSVLHMGSFEAKKSKLYSSLEAFTKADNMALAALPTLNKSTTELVDYLVNNFQHSELLKLRVIWRWITHNISYDVDSYFNTNGKSVKNEDTADVLLSGKSICSGYSNLFQTMSELAGLKVQCIPGWSKGYSFIVGTPFMGCATNHLWNAALLDGTWWLFDCTWGAGYIDDNKNFVHEYDEHFFMADPKQFIYDHFPKNPIWQLLETPINMDEYEKMGLFNKSFFNLNMKPVSHNYFMIECNNDGKVHLKFKIDKQKPVKCAGSLINSGGIHAGDQYLHIYTTDKVLHTFVTAPDKGEFTLKLFADRAESALDDHATLPLICTYLIKCTTKPALVETYPKQFKKWCHGFMLHSPMNGVLCIGETYKFKVSVTNVTKMAICLGGEKSSVVYMENTCGKVWEGDIEISHGTERITVVAKFIDSRSTTFSSLLEYAVGSARYPVS